MLRILCKICLPFVTKFFEVSTFKMSLAINFYATPKPQFQYAALLLSSHITFEVPKPDFDIYPIFLSFFLFIHPSTTSGLLSVVTSWFVCEMPEYFCEVMVVFNHFWFMHKPLILSVVWIPFSCTFPSGLTTLLYLILC